MLLAEDAHFRANPDLEVVVIDRLGSPLREALLADNENGEVYGALVPKPGTGLDPIAISPDTALLFLTLAEGGSLPSYVVERLGADAERTVSRLVLDGVLQVRKRGEFVSGPDAIEAPEMHSAPRAGTDLAVDALKYGQMLGEKSVAELALRIYCYGRRPISPRLARHVPAPEQIDSRVRGHGWGRVPLTGEAARHWHEWAPTAGPPGHRPGFKLYVSPVPEALPTAVEGLVELLRTARGVAGFKIGAGVPGLVRPDKLVAYFSRLEDLHSFARQLEAVLAGCRAHGVPFTASIDADGLLSWGADPPRQNGGAPNSWRLWLAGRLAEHLVAGASGEIEPWQFAVERLRLAGVDTTNWVPAHGMWPEALASG